MKRKKAKLEETSQNIGRLVREIKDLARDITNKQMAYDKKKRRLYTIVGSLLEEKELKENSENEEVRECLSLAEVLKSKLQNHLKKGHCLLSIPSSAHFGAEEFLLKKTSSKQIT